MKKVIITLLVALAAYGAWNFVSGTKLNLGFLDGKTVVVARGDLEIPISGTGEIRPKARSEVKPEASGEVVDIHVEVGQVVSKGTVIIRLDPQEEERSVERARNELARAKAVLSQEQIRLRQARTSNLASIDAAIKRTQAQLDEALFSFEKAQRLLDQGNSSRHEFVRTKSAHDQLVAQLDGLNADRQQAELAIELAEQSLILAGKAFETSKTNLGDAEKRLRETEILAPLDGIISKLETELGDVVQGGKTTFTGGSVLAVVADISRIYVQTEVSDADIGAVLWLAPSTARPGGESLSEELIEAGVAPVDLSDDVLLTGAPVRVFVDAFRDQEFVGVIERIYPEPRKVQNIVTYLVDIRVTSANAKLLALVLGMQAEVKFTAESVENVVLVPHDAIRKAPSGQLGVYVPEQVPEQEEPQPRFVNCRFGLDNGLYAELLEGEGIKEGVTVYTKLPSRFDPNADEDEEQ